MDPTYSNANLSSFVTMFYQKKCFAINTTRGSTYCEVYEPLKLDEAAAEQENVDKETILMLHGLGGTVKHWTDSELPSLLASKGNTVVCFDWYSHGKSTQVSSRDIPHDLNLFIQQLHDVIHSPQLPISKSKYIVAHGFSMGCYILLQYCVRYEPFSHYLEKEAATPATSAVENATNEIFLHLSDSGKNAVNSSDDGPNGVDKTGKLTSPHIHKLIFQSPWDGSFPTFLRLLVRVPLLLRICKPSDMNGITDINAFKQILLKFNHNVSYTASLDALSTAVVNGGKASANNADAKSLPIAGNAAACSVLVIAGSREEPFRITAKKIGTSVQNKLAPTITGAPAKAKSLTTNCMKSGITADAQVHYKVCRYAGHMSFVKYQDGDIGKFFKTTVGDFVAQPRKIQ